MRIKSAKNLLLSVILVIGVFSLVACSKGETKKDEGADAYKIISTQDLKSNLNDKSWVIVDTRLNDSYNGWALDGEERGGHIEGAVDFSANWLSVDNKDKEKVLEKALKTKGIESNKNIVLYDSNGKDANKVADYLSKKGYENIYTYDVKEWANDDKLPMKSYENYELIVPAKVVKDVLDGKTTETFKNAKNVKIVEASWGEEKEAYLKGHVPTSVHINTDTIEPPPAWMLANDKDLEKFALDYGFTKDDSVIVTGPDTMASYRVAVVLRYIGVNDVRVLNGGNDAWVSAGYDLETKSNKKTPGTDFGTTIPANPDLIDTIPELKEHLKNPEYTLVDDRTKDEFEGKISGYSYHDKKGRIPGAVYGYSGTSSTTLEDYRNIDNTMRNADEIKALWDKSKIDTNKNLIFMCGSGWRAAEVMTYADVIGVKNSSLYSDGWIGWSTDPANPVETGVQK
ncbi:sulfurtransferase [Metaclostridioides mangenotii]|uniref:Thiosulfate/3-mercaptopyruvate sulfurtransferase n=1 Tax=Metaclostridioides mangenotii TaxID=1540 RepID=A0ABS4ECN1_9FIRM|nr:rhodanese-like domain-containing protein [Clostridioides mangenotii]MBP1855712.1 thiosulfate/3-mercaptopyruvate sulfurtransferase [Clostridioides mangenotii]